MTDRSQLLTRLLTTAMAGLLCTLLNAIPVSAKTMQEWANENGIATDVSYQGTRVVQTGGSEFKFKERRAGKRQSIEMNMGGISGQMILREDLGTAYFIMPEMGMYREMDIGIASQQSANSLQVNNVKEVGREAINGYPSRKFKTEFKDEDGKGVGYMWITEQGVPIKSEMTYKNRRMKDQKMTMELVDLVVTEQDDSYFEIPSNMQPMNLSAVMSMAKQAQSTGNRSATTTGESNEPEDPTLLNEMGDTAKDETRRTVLNETRNVVRERLRGIGGLFKRRD